MDSCPKKEEAIAKAKRWKGKESMFQKPVPTPTPENQKPLVEEAAKPDVMERDDGLYASRYAVQDGGIPEKRTTMEKGLEEFRKATAVDEEAKRAFEEWHAKRTQIISSENAPPSSPPTPPPKYRYAYNLERDLSRDPASQDEKCHTCRGDPDDNPFPCK